MPNKEFLESYPLYRKYKMKVPKTLKGLSTPGVKLYCKKCRSVQTFIFFDYPGFNYENSSLNGEVVELIYSCGGCDDSWQYYFIKISDDLDYIMKVGQYPPWEISMNKNLKKMLGEYEETYKKGLICESQGYGIGAYAYYRRIVERIIDELLDGIVDLVSGEKKEKYTEALKETKKSHVAQDKIKIVQDLLPPILMPEGNNPLKLLYSQLSKGIHSFSDEECLKRAGNIRSILLFLVEEIISHRNSAKKFNESIKGLLSKSK